MRVWSAGTAQRDWGCCVSRTGSRPRLTDDDKLLVLAQSVVRSFLRYGAYPYAIAVREYDGDGGAGDSGVVEHRFVGLLRRLPP